LYCSTIGQFIYYCITTICGELIFIAFLGQLNHNFFEDLTVYGKFKETQFEIHTTLYK